MGTIPLLTSTTTHTELQWSSNGLLMDFYVSSLGTVPKGARRCTSMNLDGGDSLGKHLIHLRDVTATHSNATHG